MPALRSPADGYKTGRPEEGFRGGGGVNWGQESGSGLVCEFGLRVGARFKC